MPLPPPRAGREPNVIGLCQHDTLDIAEQSIERPVALQIAAAPDDAVAGAMLERNAPLPSRIMRHRAGIRNRRSDAFGLHRDRAVVGQPVAPIVEAGMQRAFDQQRAKAGAVEEQIALDPHAAVESKRGDIAAFAVQLDRGNASLDPRRAVLFGELPEKRRIARWIELVGVAHPFVRQMREPCPERRFQLQAVIVIRLAVALGQAVQPEMLEPGRPMILAGQSERMEIAVAAVAPAVEQDAELERRLRRAHEIGLADAEHAVEQRERRNGRLAHTDRTDRVGLDQRHLGDGPKRISDRGGGHPAGGAAAGDDDTTRTHCCSCRSK